MRLSKSVLLLQIYTNKISICSDLWSIDSRFFYALTQVVHLHLKTTIHNYLIGMSAARDCLRFIRIFVVVVSVICSVLRLVCELLCCCMNPYDFVCASQYESSLKWCNCHCLALINRLMDWKWAAAKIFSYIPTHNHITLASDVQVCHNIFNIYSKWFLVINGKTRKPLTTDTINKF